MRFKWFLLIVVLFMACQSGKIPCPTVKTAKIKRSTINNRASASNSYLLYAKEDSETPANEKGSRYSRTESKFVKNISVEEWDCPRPGEKKYMPKNIKDNIRRNLRRMNAGNKADSLSVQ